MNQWYAESSLPGWNFSSTWVEKEFLLNTASLCNTIADMHALSSSQCTIGKYCVSVAEIFPQLHTIDFRFIFSHTLYENNVHLGG